MERPPPAREDEAPSDDAPDSSEPMDAEQPPAGEQLVSPTFKVPGTPTSRALQTMERGFTLKRGLLTVQDSSEQTPKRMLTEHSRLDEGSARPSPGYAFRVGPSQTPASASSSAAASSSSAAAASSSSGTASTTAAAEVTPVAPAPPMPGSMAGSGVSPPAATPAAMGIDAFPWARTLMQTQEGRGKSPFSAYADSLTPLQQSSSQVTAGMMPKHSQLLPSPIEGIQLWSGLALTPADHATTPGPSLGIDENDDPQAGREAAAAAAAALEARGEALDARSDASPLNGLLGLGIPDSARLGHNGSLPRRLELPSEQRRARLGIGGGEGDRAQGSAVDMVERIVSGFEQPGSQHQPMAPMAPLDSPDDGASNGLSLQALFDDADASLKGQLKQMMGTKTRAPPKPSRSKSRQGKPKKCNCKNSKCLKLYCDCFSAGVMCDGCAAPALPPRPPAAPPAWRPRPLIHSPLPRRLSPLDPGPHPLIHPPLPRRLSPLDPGPHPSPLPTAAAAAACAGATAPIAPTRTATRRRSPTRGGRC